MKIPNELWVITRTNNDNLSYLTPADDKNQKSFEKRQQTGRDWANGYYSDKYQVQEQFIVNNPIEGFTIVGYKSRYTTQNKWIRIQDPRGFLLEISVDNLLDIVAESKISHSSIEGKFVWARDGANNRLVLVGGKDYTSAIKTQNTSYVKKSEVSVGDTIHNSYSSRIYLGKKNVNLLAKQLGFWFLVSEQKTKEEAKNQLNDILGDGIPITGYLFAQKCRDRWNLEILKTFPKAHLVEKTGMILSDEEIRKGYVCFEPNVRDAFIRNLPGNLQHLDRALNNVDFFQINQMEDA